MLIRLERSHALPTVFTLVSISVGLCLLVSLIVELFFYTPPILGNHHDFLALYGAASLTLDAHISQLYDPAALARFQYSLIHQPVGANGYMPFMYPPFTAVLLLPLSFLSEPLSRLIWFVLNAMLILVVVFQLTRGLRKGDRFIAIALLGMTFPVYQALIEGQPSIIMAWGCLTALSLAFKRAYIRSGIFLSVLWIKPHIGLFVLCGLLFFHYWKVALSMISVALTLFLVLLPITGTQLYLTYSNYLLGVSLAHFAGAGVVSNTVWSGSLQFTEGINGFLVGVFGQQAVSITTIGTIFLSVVLLLIFVYLVRKTRLPALQLSPDTLLVASIALLLLIDPHLYPQDVVLSYATLPLWLRLSHNSTLTVLAFSLICDVVMLDQFSPIHLFTLIVMAVFVLSLYPQARWRLLGSFPAGEGFLPAGFARHNPSA